MQLPELFEAFNGKRVLVVGDVMTDAYINGQVNRMSPEAPVPVVDLQTQEQRIGGAGNVALNLIALGAKALLASVIGQDAAGQELQQMLTSAGIQTDALIVSAERKTTIKTRVLSNRKQMLRIDTEDQHDLTATEANALKNSLSKCLEQGIDGIILEDYNKGILTKDLIEWVIAEANKRNIPTAVDPKKKNFLSYKHCTLFKPNLKELKENQEQVIEVAFDYRVEKQFIESISFLKSAENIHDTLWMLTFSTSKDMRSKVFDFAHDNGLKILQLNTKNKNLESLFRELTT